MSSASSRESSTMSTCRGSMALRVPNSSSVSDFIGLPGCSSFLSRVDRLTRCCLSGRWNRRKPQLRLDAVQEFRECNGLLGRPETSTHAEFEWTPGTDVTIEHDNAFLQTLAEHRSAGLRRVHGQRRKLRLAKTGHNVRPAETAG